MILWLLVFTSLAYAQESFEKYCFSSGAVSARALAKTRPVLVPSDQVSIDGPCFTVTMKPHRRELIQRFVLHSEPSARVDFSSENMKKEPCSLSVEKEKASVNDSRDITINAQGIGGQETKSPGKSLEVMTIQTLDAFELGVDQDTIQGKCRYITADKYEITLTVKKERKPLYYPPVQPGTVVVVTTPPTDEKTFTLSTQLILNRGDRIEVGSVLKDEEQKNRSASIDPQFSWSESQKNATEKVYLKLN